MNAKTAIEFTDNKTAQMRPDQYIEITIDIARTLESWKNSLYSFEWLENDGSIKPLNALSENEQAKRRAVEEALETGQPLEKPLLGIGILDNIEIGSGRAVLLTLAAKGQTTMPVHIPKSCESDFKAFRA
ncbi:MAG TPA: hypothetical protein PK513_02810 [Alphaproteobacteria bacterium]|nr:hypothetical protein [Alphaproteobacteria bacterium]USO05317.1 MAG: hypothetical protein H6859_09215 [Rhodospirillales bacterium]HOO81416.1 hypothetical protein [Alphaproteobacteria bacterium]